MKADRKANFLIFFTIAIIALGLSNFAAVFTGDLVSATLPGINGTEKLIALDDDNFSPASLNTVYEEKTYVEEVNDTADDNDTDSTDDSTDETDNSESQSTSTDNSDQSSTKPESSSSSSSQTEDDE